MASLQRPRIERATGAVFGTFFLNGFVLGNWIPRIPDVKVLHGLTASELGLALFAIAMGTLVSFLTIGRFIGTLGLRRACMLSLPIFAIAVAATPFAPNYLLLLVVALCGGIGIGIAEVDVEEREGWE